MTGKAASAKGAAARSEKNGAAPNQIKYRGLTLKLPKKLPFNVLQFLGGQVTPATVVDVLVVILGEDQMQEVWDANLDIDQGTELMDKVLSTMGLELGESPASQSSSTSAGSS